MTIKVTVKNDDARESAVIGVTQYSVTNPNPSSEHEIKLKGGESAEVWVHSGQSVNVKEISQ